LSNATLLFGLIIISSSLLTVNELEPVCKPADDVIFTSFAMIYI